MLNCRYNNCSCFILIILSVGKNQRSSCLGINWNNIGQNTICQLPGSVVYAQSCCFEYIVLVKWWCKISSLDAVWPDCQQILLNIWPFVTIKICWVASEIANVGTKVCQILNQLFQKLPKDFSNFAKVAKFCQIWSHWRYHPQDPISYKNLRVE